MMVRCLGCDADVSEWAASCPHCRADLAEAPLLGGTTDVDVAYGAGVRGDGRSGLTAPLEGDWPLRPRVWLPPVPAGEDGPAPVAGSVEGDWVSVSSARLDDSPARGARFRPAVLVLAAALVAFVIAAATQGTRHRSVEPVKQFPAGLVLPGHLPPALSDLPVAYVGGNGTVDVTSPGQPSDSALIVAAAVAASGQPPLAVGGGTAFVLGSGSAGRAEFASSAGVAVALGPAAAIVPGPGERIGLLGMQAGGREVMREVSLRSSAPTARPGRPAGPDHASGHAAAGQGFAPRTISSPPATPWPGRAVVAGGGPYVTLHRAVAIPSGSMPVAVLSASLVALRSPKDHLVVWDPADAASRSLGHLGQVVGVAAGRLAWLGATCARDGECPLHVYSVRDGKDVLVPPLPGRTGFLPGGSFSPAGGMLAAFTAAAGQAARPPNDASTVQPVVVDLPAAVPHLVGIPVPSPRSGPLAGSAWWTPGGRWLAFAGPEGSLYACSPTAGHWSPALPLSYASRPPPVVDLGLPAMHDLVLMGR